MLAIMQYSGVGTMNEPRVAGVAGQRKGRALCVRGPFNVRCPKRSNV